MLLYQRFEIPDNSNWQPGQPVPARDCLTGRDVFAYRSELASGERDRQIAVASSFIAEQIRSNSWHASEPEIFTAEGFLWVITDRASSGELIPDPVIGRLREAGLFPAFEQKQIPPPLPPAAKQCPRCKRELTDPGPLCSLCLGQVQEARKKRSCLLVGLAVLAGVVVLGSALTWLVWSAVFSASTAPSLSAQFFTSRAVISEGDSVSLSWNVSGASAVTIDHGIGPVDAHGSLSVTPAFNTTYTLTAASGSWKILREVTIDVVRGSSKPPPGQLPAGQPAPDAGAQTPSQPAVEPPSASFPTPPPDTTVSQTRQPEPPSPAPPIQQPASSVPPSSGNLRCTEPVPPGGQVRFENLPGGFLHFDVQDRANWRLLIRRQPDGGQTLIMVSQSPQTQNSCAVRWSMEP